MFKYVLNDNKIRPSFFHAFIPNLAIQSSERLDDHMNPFEKFQILRNFIHKNESSTVMNFLAQSNFKVVVTDESGIEKADGTATMIIEELAQRFDEIKVAFPKLHYGGTMDFVCQLANDDYAMIEMQVITKDYWDRRALAYVAAFYGNQLKKVDEWKNIRKVIGINILGGGGKDSKVALGNTSNQFMRH